MVHRGVSKPRSMLHTDLAFTHTDKKGLWAVCYKLLGSCLDSLLSRVGAVSMASRACSECTSVMLEIYLENLPSSQNRVPVLAGSVSISLEDCVKCKSPTCWMCLTISQCSTAESSIQWKPESLDINLQSKHSTPHTVLRRFIVLT